MASPDWESRCFAIAAQSAGDTAHDKAHLLRVLRLARRIAAAEGPHNPEVLTAAAILHDLVSLPKDHPDRAQSSRLAAVAAADALRSEGFPEDLIPAVAHAIAAHSFSAAIPAETPEARALQDADRLDALGAIGLARMFAVAGSLGRALYDPEDPMALHRDLDDGRFTLDHLEVKLFRLAETMQTSTGRAMAEERAEWMQSFRTRLLSEVE